MTTTTTTSRVRAVQELRRSNAARRHTPKPRKGTRRANRQAAIKEQERNHQ